MEEWPDRSPAGGCPSGVAAPSRSVPRRRASSSTCLAALARHAQPLETLALAVTTRTTTSIISKIIFLTLTRHSSHPTMEAEAPPRRPRRGVRRRGRRRARCAAALAAEKPSATRKGARQLAVSRVRRRLLSVEAEATEEVGVVLGRVGLGALHLEDELDGARHVLEPPVAVDDHLLYEALPTRLWY